MSSTSVSSAVNRVSASTHDTAHIVRVDRKLKCASASLSPEILGEIEAALRAAPWWDRWSGKKLRKALFEIMRTRSPGGLAIVAPGLSFETPPAFTEFFEPIQFGVGAEELKTLSGAAPTRNERQLRVIAWILGVVGVIAVTALLVSWLATGSARIVGIIGGMIAFTIVLIMLVVSLQRLFGSWFLLPSAVAIARYFPKPTKLSIFSRRETLAMIRLVSNGKTVMLMLELILPTGKRRATSVSDREAISFLAAWQSPHDPPTREQLSELAA